MSELDVQLAGKSLADYTNTQLRLALGAVLYTNTADMWKQYLNQLGYSGDVSQMLQKYYIDYSVPSNFRNYINAGAFIYSPQQLFVDGSKGVIFDNADLSSFYLDSAGTTAATVNGLVGLQLDKSANLALGAEILVNNDFSNGSTGWAVTGNDATHVVTFSGGSVRYQSDTTTPVLQLNQAFSPTVSAWYLVEIVVSNYVSGSLKFDSDFGDVAVPATVGTHRFYFKRDSGGFSLYRNSANVDITIDSVSIKRLSGDHRYQTTTGSKPVLRGTPVGSSLVTNGDFASGLTGWTNPDTAPATTTASGGTVTMNNGTTGTARLRQALTVSAGSYLITFTVTGFSGATSAGNLSIGNTTNGDIAYGSVGINANGTYTRYVDNVTGPTLGLAFIITAGTATSFTLDNVSVVNVSAGQVTAPYGLQYDGVDDFLQTAAVDFTATDKMFVCAGVRKLSDAARGMLVELSATVGSNNGSFAIDSPSTALNDYQFFSRGTSLAQNATSGFSAPISNVVTGIGDISGDICQLGVNGVSDTISVDQGTGNFGNYAIYFGRRGGTSVPYNGLDFGFVICGKTLTSTQISSTERYIAQRTGISI